MQQVILNFILNAADAIGDEAGRIIISTGSMHASRALLDQFYNGSNLQEGKYIFINISDSGCGMDKETQAKIFDPFFTTKEKGSGLGLSAVLGIVRGNRGAIHVISQPAKGTMFRVLLPCPDHVVAKKEITTAELKDWQGEGTALIVDDDEVVRDVGVRMLERFGFDTLQASDGVAGLDVFRMHRRKITVVLLDMTMPRLGGVDTMEKIRKIDPDVPILLVSGYNKVAARALAGKVRPDAFIHKPYKLKDMKKALYEVFKEPQ
jgi:CheY-like chemotaxis protein